MVDDGQPNPTMDGDHDWSRLLSRADIPHELADIKPEDALGYLNQSLVGLIRIYDTLPSELDTAAAIVNGEIKSRDYDKISNTNTTNNNFTKNFNNNNNEIPNQSAIQDDDNSNNSSAIVSPLNMAKDNSDFSTPTSPSPLDTESALRRRRRSSVMTAEATAVSGAIGPLENLRSLRGRQAVEEDEDGNSTTDSREELYKLSISRRFWSKTPPDISTWKYLLRIHHYCPASTSVYLSAAVYICRLCVVLKVIPLTTLSVHRLVLAALRVASKSVEDINHPQKRFAMVGGIPPTDLYRLEIALLFLLDFDIKVDAIILRQSLEFIVELDAVVSKCDGSSHKRIKS